MKSTVPNWPMLRHYDQQHLQRIALPLGGIGTGTVSLGGRGNLIDWEVMDRPAKGYLPSNGRSSAPMFALWTKQGDKTSARLLESAISPADYEGETGCTIPLHGVPRFQKGDFSSAYPLAQINLSDPACPLKVRLDAFNPLIPTQVDDSSLPVATFRYVLENNSQKPVTAAICAALPNFIGCEQKPGTLSRSEHSDEWGLKTEFCEGRKIRGLRMTADNARKDERTWGSLALATTASKASISTRTAMASERWGGGLLAFWDSFSATGELHGEAVGPTMSYGFLNTQFKVPPKSQKTITFYLAWHFPNRMTWTPAPKDESCCGGKSCDASLDRIGNHYCERFDDAWAAAEHMAGNAARLERETIAFVNAVCESPLPVAVREAALFNLSTLRTQTCFRTPDGYLFGWEGCNDQQGCCLGSCTHVWNYEQATAFLFGELALGMRDVEFGHATNDLGLMSFRVHLPIDRAQEYKGAAADGQLGCVMKLYRDWQLSGNRDMLEKLWPAAKRSLEFCWLPGSWDGDGDGVMEGCQHNTMDVEYYGPNPQMQGWYLGALRAGEEMARFLGDDGFADKCRELFAVGSEWMDTHLFNGEYYEHEIRPAADNDAVMEALRVGMGAADVTKPEYQLGTGCLVDQLVGQFMAHVCGLGYLHRPANVRKTLRSIMKYNHQKGFHEHFNCMRSYVMGDENALLMASYPHGERPEQPFPYYAEVMTGFEYTAAVGMLYEGQERNGLACIRDVRDRYDGFKRNPFDEAECGHHYARAMAAWGALLALSGFNYSAVTGELSFGQFTGPMFWSNGYAWGTCEQDGKKANRLTLHVHGGRLNVKTISVRGVGTVKLPRQRNIRAGGELTVTL